MFLARKLLASFLLLVIGVVSACSRDEPPRGQVVAIVDDIEITVAELNEEARARGLPIANDVGLRNALVEELVQRKLLVAEAKQQGFDRSPQYLLAKRRSEEILLGQQLLAASAQAWSPSEEDLRRFVASNPHVFGARTQFKVSFVRLPGRTAEPLRLALADAATPEASRALLAKAGIKDAHSTDTWDSANLPVDWVKALLSLEVGRPFYLSAPAGAVAGTLLEKEPQPISPERAAAVARDTLDQQRREVILQRLVHARRSDARIRYHPNYKPGPATN